MTPKEKAIELVNKYDTQLKNDLNVFYSYSHIEGEEECARRCAIICVEQIIDAITVIYNQLIEWEGVSMEGAQYWRDVKKHLQNS